jgi:hypothetical protein
LNEGEQRSQRQVEQLERLNVYLNFERCERWPAQQQNHAEAGEVEEEDQQRGGEQPGTQERESDIPPDAPPVCAEGAGSSFEGRIEPRKPVPDQADDDGRVVKNMGQQDRAQSADEMYRRSSEPEPLHEAKVDPAARAKQGVEPSRDDHRRQHERDRRQRPQQGFAAKVKAGKEEGRRQADHKGQEGGKQSLI